MTERCSERFQKSLRLTDSRDYQKVFKQEFRSADDTLLMLAASRPGLPARLGLAISKKKVSAATDRNRLKRLIRESFRKNKDRLAGLDIVVISHRHLSKIENPVIINSLRRHWQRLEKCAPSSSV